MSRLALAFLLLLPGAARAAEGAAFLSLGAGARAAAMGGAMTALADDVDSAYWNPAGLARIERSELKFTHRESVAGIRYEVLGFARRAAGGVLSVTGGYLGHEALPGRDEFGAPTGSFGAYDLTTALHYAAAPAFLPGTSLGAGVRYVRSKIAEASAQTAAADLGAQWRAAEPLGPGTPSLGLAVRNLGPGLRFLEQSSALPLAVSAGAGYRLNTGLLFAADFTSRPNAGIGGFAAGLEQTGFRAFTVRAGYSTLAAQTKGEGLSRAMRGFTVGFGVVAAGWTLDYGMVPMGELGNAQTFTLGARF